MTLYRFPFAIAAAIIGAAAAVPVPAASVINFTQLGSKGVAMGGGAIAAFGLTLYFEGAGGTEPFVAADEPTVTMVSGANNGVSGPSAFGPGATQLVATSFGGDAVAFESMAPLPAGYVSRAALADIAIWNDETFGGLGPVPGNQY